MIELSRTVRDDPDAFARAHAANAECLAAKATERDQDERATERAKRQVAEHVASVAPSWVLAAALRLY